MGKVFALVSLGSHAIGLAPPVAKEADEVSDCFGGLIGLGVKVPYVHRSLL